MPSNDFVKIELFDSEGKLVSQQVKQTEERLMIPVQTVPTATSYKLTYPGRYGGVIEGALIPVYEF